MSGWTEEYARMVDDCEKRESHLTDWERGFLDSIGRQLEREKPPTAKQIETLEKIWERVTVHHT